MERAVARPPGRGFSGEGGLLHDLVSPGAEAAAARVDALDSADPAALTWLSAHGHVGYDVADQSFFWRHLPDPDEALRAEAPRLRDARSLTVEPRPGGGYAVAGGWQRIPRVALGRRRFSLHLPLGGQARHLARAVQARARGRYRTRIVVFISSCRVQMIL
jgi:hypothetical protein